MIDCRLICADVDGTLLNSNKRITYETAYWIRRAVEEKGIVFAIVSGRLPSAVNPFFETLQIRGAVSSFNGGSVYDENGKLLVEHRLDKKVSLDVLKIIREMNLSCCMFDGENWITEAHEGFLYEEKKLLYGTDSVVRSYDELINDCGTNKICVKEPDKDKFRAFVKRLKDSGWEENHLYFWIVEETNYIEITGKDYSKGTAVEILMDYYGISKENVAVFGDEANDISMFKAAGIGIAMGNAIEEVKKISSYVTRSCDEDGIAHAIKTLFFGLEEDEFFLSENGQEALECVKEVKKSFKSDKSCVFNAFCSSLTNEVAEELVTMDCSIKVRYSKNLENVKRLSDCGIPLAIEIYEKDSKDVYEAVEECVKFKPSYIVSELYDDEVIQAMDLFYNKGQSSMWVHCITETLNISACNMFFLFAKWLRQTGRNTQEDVFILQDDFVTSLFEKTRNVKLLPAMKSFMELHQAINYVTETGDSVPVELSYSVESLSALDKESLSEFVKTKKMKNSSYMVSADENGIVFV